MTAHERVKQWNALRPKLKAKFAAMNVTSCEVCGSTFALSFAHRVKRRFIHTDAELATVALLCAEHHHAIEYGGNMYTRINEIIESRST